MRKSFLKNDLRSPRMGKLNLRKGNLRLLSFKFKLIVTEESLIEKDFR